ncbi:hypothetical protein BGZ59_000744 [Podila verticillata]|nr:hypothetical protein BGZ59_000744 [Podila verticillata]
MLVESETWNRNRWWLFERIVESPHKTSYYTEDSHDLAEVSGWTYNGKKQDPPRKFLKEMDEAKLVVRKIVNELRSARELHPYEEQGEWKCNVAAVNHYAHSKESVGWHADKLTYLGPRPTIGSLTLGATRFFRIRKVVPDVKNPDTAGQMISIALPHNSLCIMWPPMNKANYGKYFYMCYAAGSQEGKTCGEFHWVDMEAKLGLVKLEEEDDDDPLDLASELLDDVSPIQAPEEGEAE